MAGIFRTLRRYWSSLRLRWVWNRVSFSPSTLTSDRLRALRKIASPVPFQNYLNDIRLTSLQDMGTDKMPLRESLRIRRSAVRLWSNLSEDSRRMYREIADNWQTTRLPLENIPKSVANLSVPESNNPEVMPDAPAPDPATASDPVLVPAPSEMTEARCRPRRSCRRQPVKRRARSRSVSKKRSRSVSRKRCRSVPRKRRVKKPPEIIAPTEKPKRLSRKRRMGAEERRSSEIFVNLSKCISRIDFPENNAPDLSTHHLPKRKRNS